jgi:carbon storage regulator
MLILSRKCGESIMIGDEIEVRVLNIGGGKVRLGVTGPAWVPVHQRERYEARRLGKGSPVRAGTEGILAR